MFLDVGSLIQVSRMFETRAGDYRSILNMSQYALGHTRRRNLLTQNTLQPPTFCHSYNHRLSRKSRELPAE